MADQGINIDGLQKEINGVVESLNRLDATLNHAAVQATVIDRIFGNMKGLKEFVDTVKQIDDKPAVNFKKIASGISDLTLAMKRLNSEALAKSANINTSISGLLSFVDRLDKRLSQIKPNEGLEGFIKTIRTLKSVAGQDAGSLNPENAKKTVDFFDVLVGGLSASVAKAGGIDESGVLKSFSSTLRGLVKTTAAIVSEEGAKLDINKAKEFLNFFSAIAGGLTGITAKVQDTGNIDGLSSLVKTLNKTSGIIKAITEASASLPQSTGILGKLGIGAGSKFAGIKEYVSFISFLGNQLGSAATKIASSADLGAVDTLITSISKISSALPRIIEASKNLPKGSAVSNFFAGLTGFRIGKFKGLQEFLSFVKFLAKQLSGIAGKAADIEGFSSLTKVVDSIKGVSKAIPQIIEASKTLPTGSKLGNFLGSISNLKVGKFKSLKDFFDFVRFIAQQLTRLPKNIPNVGDAFKGIANLSSVLQGVDISNTQNVKGFKAYVQQLVSGLDQLDSLKIDTRRLTSIGNALSALPKALPGIVGSSGVNPSDAKTIEGVVNNILRIQNTNAIIKTVLSGVGQLVLGFARLDTTVVNFLKETGDKFKNFGTQVTQLGQNLIQNLGFNKFFQLPGFDIAKQFDKITAQLKVAGFSKEQIKDAQDFSDVIGIKYPLSANQALDAILSLKKAGEGLPDIKKILPTAADLTALTNSQDLNAVTNTLIAVGNTFDKFTDKIAGGFDNISVASDQIVAAADASTASIESIQQGLADVGPAANQVGLSLQDTVAALAEFDQFSLKGSEGGRALKGILNQLVRKQTVDELTRLNVAVKNQDGTFRSLDGIFKDLNKRYADLHFSQTDIAKSLATMFDTFARGGASILLTKNGISDMKAEMAKSATTADKFNQSMDNLIGDSTQLQGSVETLLKDAFLPLISRAFRPVIQLINKVVNALIGLPPAVKDTVINTVLLASAFASIVGAGVVLIGTLSQISGGFLSMSATVTELAINIIPTIGSIVALGSSLLIALPILALAGAAFITLGFYTTSFFNAIENNIGGASDSLKRLQGAVSSFFDTVKGIGKEIGFAYNEVFGPIVALARENFGKDVAGFFDRITSKIQQFNRSLKGITVENIAKAFTTIAPIVTDTVNALQQSGSGLLQALLGDSAGVEKFKSNFARVLRDVTLGVARTTGADLAKAIFAFNKGDIGAGINALLSNIGNTLRSFIVKNRSIIETGVEFLVKFFSPFSKISTILRLIGLDKLAGVFDEITNRIFGSVKAALNVIFDLLSGKSLRQSFNENFGQIGDSISNFIDQIQISFQQISKIVEIIINQFVPTFQQIGVDLGKIDFTQALKGILDIATGGLKFVNDNILIPLAENLPRIIEFVKKLAAAAGEALGPLIGFGKQLLDAVLTPLKGLSSVLSGGVSFSDWATKTIGNLGDVIKTLPFRIGQTLFNFGKLFNSEFLMNLGAAIAQGDISGIVSTLIQQLLAIISSVVSRIPFLIKDLGKTLHSQFLISIGQALQVGDFGSLVEILKNGIANLFKNAFDGAVKAIDHFIDLFDNRVVGGIVLVLGVALVAALPFIIPVLVGGITGLFGIVAGLVVAPIQALGSLLGLTFLSSITFPAVGIAALVAGFIGLVAFAVVNDPDAAKVGSELSNRISDGFEAQNQNLAQKIQKTTQQAFKDGLNDLYDKAIKQRVLQAFNGLDNAVQFGMEKAFNAANQIDIIAGWGNAIGAAIRKAIGNILNGFGEGPVFSLKTALGELFSLPTDTITSAIAAIGSAVRTLASLFGELYNTAKQVVLFFVDGFGAVLSVIGDIIGGVLTLVGVAKQVVEFVKQIAPFVVIVGILAAGIIAASASTGGFTGLIQKLTASMVELATSAFGAAAGVGAAGAAEQGSSLLQLEDSVGKTTGLFGTLKNVIGGKGGVGPLLLELGKTILKFAAVIVIVEALKAAFDGIKEALDKKDLFQGFLTFLGNLSVGLLKLVGLNDLATQIQTTMDQLKAITKITFDQIGQQILKTFSGINVAIEDAVNRAKTLAGKDDAGTKAFFKVGDDLKSAGTKSADDFFAGLQVGLQDPGVRDSVSSELIAQGDVVLSKFFDGLTKRGGQLDISFAANTFKSLDISGGLQEAIDTASSGGFNSLNTIKQVLLGDPELGKKYFADYIHDIVDQATKGNLTKQQIGVFTQSINDALSKGFISSQQAADGLKGLGDQFDSVTVAAGGADARFKELNTSISDLFASAKDKALGDAKKQFEAGTITAEQYVEKLTEFGSTIPALVNSLRDQQLKDLSDMFNAGVISLNQYNDQAAGIIAKARNFSLDAIKDTLNEITSLSTSGATIDTITKSITQLNGQLNNLGNVPPDIQARLDAYTKNVAAGILKGADAAKVAEKIYADLAEAQSKVAATAPPPTAATTSLAPLFNASGDSANAAVGDIGAVSDEIDRVQQKIEDFGISQTRQHEKDAEEEQKAQNKISEIDTKARQDKEKAEAEFALSEKRALEDEQNALNKINLEASASIQDAINSRDEQGALAASKARDKQIADTQSQFAIEDARRQEDEKLRLADLEVKRIEDHNAAVIELNELRKKNITENQQRVDDFNRDIARERNKSSINKQYKDQEAAASINASKTMANAAQTSLNSVVTAASSTQTQIGSIIQGIANIALPVISAITGINTSGITNLINSLQNQISTSGAINNAGGTITPTRAKGGPVTAGKTFEVLEPNANLPFELARFGNRTFLLAGQNGMIEAPVSSSRAGLTASSAGGGGLNVTFDFSSMSIQGGVGADASQIAEQVEARIIPKLTSTIRQLRTEKAKL